MGFDEVNRAVVGCERCVRLRDWCEKVGREKRKSFMEDDYWTKPVPNFGDPEARGLVVGLAPAAHGANRTGRMFTGDRSGDWLYRAMFRAGLANQETAVSLDDGLELRGVLITACCHCAPPDNKPTREEVANCHGHLEATLALREWKAFLCLGGLAWKELHKALGVRPVPKFGHGVESVVDRVVILGSYHPSQQNTFTGRLTEEMLDSVMGRFAQLVG